jgi:undecaprenyl diphosphate synthase
MSQNKATLCSQGILKRPCQAIEDIYTEDELASLDTANVPAHIAIIPDGNRRWARSSVRSTEEGHIEGAEVLIKTVKAAKRLGSKILSVFAFSTENWKRSEQEVSGLMQLYERYLVPTLPLMLNNNIRFSTIGDIATLPRSLVKIIDETKRQTQHCTEFDLILAFNYGGRDEICRAVNRMINDIATHKLHNNVINEKLLASYLDTFGFPDPDLLIRTSGEKRISNFLLWQSSYTELYIEEDPWPKFSPQHLLRAVLDFQQRERRHGGGVV